MRSTTDIEGLESLSGWLEKEGARRVLLLTTPSRRFVDRLGPVLAAFETTLFDGAKTHVPREVVERASAALRECGADTIVSLGGGSATGLGKALRLTHDVRFVAIPTTYAGSERTQIYGVRDGEDKNTGRDSSVRPDRVVLAPTLLAEMPLKLTITSLLNALAHPISALTVPDNIVPDNAVRNDALNAIADLTWALDQLLEAPLSRAGRAAALRGCAMAGSVLDRAALGEHHRVAHQLGGHFGLDHAGLHAVLLPHFVRRIADDHPELYDAIAEAAGTRDLPAALYDALTRGGAARSLTKLGVPYDAHEALRLPWVDDALLGRRPSLDTRRWDLAGPPTSVRGPSLEDAKRVVITLHGRGGNADRTLRDTLDLIGHDPDTLIVAPQGPRNRWYALPYRSPRDEHEEDLELSLAAVSELIDHVLERAPAARVYLAGFSQGACLASTIFLERGSSLAGLVALAGARIGGADEGPVRSLTGKSVLLGIALDDPWVDHADVVKTAEVFRAAGADVRLVCGTGDGHETTTRQRMFARELLLERSVREGSSGFGNAHDSEALPGALPRHQNSPRRAPYGLHAEQINGTGFGALRRDNVRSWMYRIRPSARHSAFAPLVHPTLKSDWHEGVEANLCGWRPLPAPETATDFIDGLATFGGAGHPNLRRGYAVHLYAANRSMEHRAFYDADGDLLLVPQQGALTLQTELGLFDVAPGQIAVLPRGLSFSVHLHDGFARGCVAEVYGRHFELPERGPVGSNGLTDPRHFRAPTAYFEHRLDPGYRITMKLGNELFEATQDHPPYDVVAWHGDYAPHVYDLRDFSPVGNTRIDHGDPSIFCVIGAPLDEAGASSLDFVFFPPRSDATEHTFRPPFFHRNAITEFNGIISDPDLDADSPFEPGCTFLTPPMTAHGVLTQAVERASRHDTDAPVRIGDSSMWFQLESALPLLLTRWARENAARIGDWPSVWGSYRPRFDPGEP